MKMKSLTATDLPIIKAGNLSALTSVSHGFFTRQGGVSKGIFASLNVGQFSADKAENIQCNRERVAAALGADRLVTLRQVHGNVVHRVTDDWDADKVVEGDGLVTRIPRIALGALGADCATVLFADPGAGVLGVAHAGWRGALAGVTDSVIRNMTGAGAQIGRIESAIGPAIQVHSYEVGEELMHRFQRRDGVRSANCFVWKAGRCYFNLTQYIANRISDSGVRSIVSCEEDTYTDEHRFYSYRRACHRGEKQHGRQVGAICLL